MKAIYRSTGECVASLQGRDLYDLSGRSIGYLDDDNGVFLNSGAYLGSLYQMSYVVKSATAVRRGKRAGRIAPVMLTPLVSIVKREKIALPVGYVDAL